MAGQLLLRCRSSSLSSPTNFLSNLSTLYRAFSAASPPRIKLTTDYYSSKLGEAERSEHWEEFESWMLQHQKCCRSDKEILYRFTIFSQRLNNIQKLKNELVEAKCSEEWKVFEGWMSEQKKRYRSDKEMLYRFNIFTDQSMKSVEELNKKHGEGSYVFADLTDEDRPAPAVAVGKMTETESMLAEVAKGMCSKDKEWIHFTWWMAQHKKEYKSKEEMMHRYMIFKKNLNDIKELNYDTINHSRGGWLFDLNRFSDLASEELSRRKPRFSELSTRKRRLYKRIYTLH